MNQRIKQYFLWAVAAGVIYFLLSYHIIYSKKRFYLLEKAEKTLEYTFYSFESKQPENILSIDVLRDDGVGELLVELGFISEDEMWDLVNQYEYEED